MGVRSEKSYWEKVRQPLLKRALACLLSAAMCVAFTPAVAWGAEISYVNASGGAQTCSNPTPVTDGDTGWGTEGNTTWYVVNGNVTIGAESTPQRVTVSGNVNLILADGCTLTVNGGIQVQDDDNDPSTASANSLTVYGQSTNESTMGKLIAQNAESKNAGIGGNDGGVAGTVIINGGEVTATGGGSNGAGIGGGHYAAGGTVTINGGKVTATGGEFAAGIGGGAGDYQNVTCSGGTIVISGGTVKATGSNGAGIGGGHKGAGGKITISGGTVTATGGQGAGIGGGYGGAGGTITISDGEITATSSSNGAGVGGGREGAGGTITISGGTVTASGGSYGAGIGGGSDRAGGTITISGGTVTASGGSRGAGIGGGSGGSTGGKIIINGGEVTANGGGYGGAGIGGGYSYPDSGAGGEITINGGNVTANGGSGGAGIGGGHFGAGGAVIISGGTVTASSGSGGAGIGKGSDAKGDNAGGTFSTGTNGNAVVFANSISDNSDEKKASWSGVIFVGANGKIYGSSVIEPTESFMIPAGKTLTIGSGETLTIPSGKTLTIENGGTLTNYGTVNGEVVAYGTISGTGSASNVTYRCIVTFDSNGGSKVDSATPKLNTEITAPTDPTKTGHTFGGWYTDQDCSDKFYFNTPITSSITLYAKWTANTYTVTFDANGGSGTMGRQTFTYDQAQELSANTYTKTGHHFTGWKDGDTGAVYNDKASVKNLTATNEGTVTLTAQWAADTYNVTLNTSGGSINSGNIESYTYGVGATLPQDVTRSGYRFAGWYDNESCTGDAVTAISASETGDKAYYAKWQYVPPATPQASSDCNKAISSLPDVDEVTLGSGEAIKAARSAYDALTSYQKSFVAASKVAKLEAVEARYADLVAVAPVEEALEALPDVDGVTLESGEAIQAARGAYDALSDHHKALIPADALARLEAAEVRHTDLVAVAPAEEALEALPQAEKLKAKDAKAAAEAAEAALAQVAGLTEAQQALVDKALAANAQAVVAQAAELVANADAKAADKVKNKKLAVKSGKSKSIAFKTKLSAADTKVVYKKASGSKYITVTKSGKVTAKKGMKRGKTYAAKVKVVCGNSTRYVKVVVSAR